jgi:hypothetical protein
MKAQIPVGGDLTSGAEANNVPYVHHPNAPMPRYVVKNAQLTI